MWGARKCGRTLLVAVSATLILATACTTPVNDTWHLRARKGTATVGERIEILPAEKEITKGCVGLANGDSIRINPEDFDWTVAPSGGRVVGSYFVADEPGTYKLTPVITVDSAPRVPEARAGMALGPTMTIKVLAAEGEPSQAPDSETQAAVDTPEPSADAPLAGTWTYVGMVVTGEGTSATWAPSPNTGTLVIEKRADGYYLQISEGTSTATLNGTDVVLERNFPSLGVSVRYTGVLSGDTITGTQHTEANGATHDDPWTATRVR